MYKLRRAPWVRNQVRRGKQERSTKCSLQMSYLKAGEFLERDYAFIKCLFRMQ